MINGSYKETTGSMTMLANKDNSANPGIIITQNAYFVVERITGSDGQYTNIMVNFQITTGQKTLGNTPSSSFNIPYSNLGNGSGLSNPDGRPVLIISPKSNIQVICTNGYSGQESVTIELEGYYINENGLRLMDGQGVDTTILNKLL